MITFAAGMIAGIAILTATLYWDRTGSYRPLPIQTDLTVEVLVSYCSRCGPGSLCTPIEEGGTVSFCMGVVADVIGSRPEMARLCLPNDWDVKQAIPLFLAWAGRHQESRGMKASDGILRSHAASFACHGGNSRGEGV